MDILRILATLAVIIIHVSARLWYTVPGTFDWYISNIGVSVTRWSVPVFVMISGTILLGRTWTRPFNAFLKKNVLRMITAYLFWSLVYAVGITILRVKRLDCEAITLIKSSFIQGHYHMWFLPMITVLYLFVPILRCLCQNEKVMQYFLVLALLFQIMANTVGLFYTEETIYGHYAENAFLIQGYTCYFILGHYLHTHKLSPKMRKWAYMAGLLGVLVTYFGCSIVSVLKNEAVATFFDYLALNNFATSVAIYIACQQWAETHVIKEERQRKLTCVSELTFGAYLVHDIFIMGLNHIGYFKNNVTPLLIIPAGVFLVAVGSLATAWCLKRIPWLNKYIS